MFLKIFFKLCEYPFLRKPTKTPNAYVTKTPIITIAVETIIAFFFVLFSLDLANPNINTLSINNTIKTPLVIIASSDLNLFKIINLYIRLYTNKIEQIIKL